MSKINWNRLETMLALKLYLSLDGIKPLKDDEKIIALSTYLRNLPYNFQNSKNVSFRNPDGVVCKLKNLQWVATGKGLRRISKMDKEIWEEFKRDIKKLEEAILKIKTTLGLA
jgi:5-methylcytosine-specific restriction protein A